MKLDDKAMMGARPWHLHDSHGLTLCAGNNRVCHAVDAVADPAADYAGAKESHDGRLEYARFERMRDCVNGLARVPNPDGVWDAIGLVLEIADEDEGLEVDDEVRGRAREAALAMGFLQDEEDVAEALMKESDA